ncbi:MAG: zf-HC2 domain-containing protein [Acidobacteria bacterium]|nr:zf-HC2 domain-containing protein [Acidobacteriota bacterium]
MTNCWPEGVLRAYLDRELPPAEMRAVADHLAGCAECDALCAELAGRAARVFALIDELPAAGNAARLRPAPARTFSRWLWPGVAAALAAGLAIASFTLRRPEPPAPLAHNPAPVQRQPQAPEPVAPVAPAAVPAVARSAVSRVAPRRRPAAPSMDYFVALDDQPIDSGVIMRMAVQPGGAQADIIVDPQGRARAIRLVGTRQ